MPRPSDELKDRALAAISAANEASPKPDWAAVHAGFPGVNRSTFYRWIAEMRKGNGTPPEVREKSRKRVLEPDIVDNLPMIPPPRFFDAYGAAAKVDMDMMRRSVVIQEDLMAIREKAFYEEGHPLAGKVKNPQALLLNIDRRVTMLNTELKILERIYDLKFMMEFMEGVVEIIKRHVHDPETWQRIARDLQRLNDRHNMTPAARG